MLRPAHDIVGRVPLPLQQEVGLADGVGLGVDLLSVQVRGDLLAALGSQPLQSLLGNRQHAPRAASAVVEQVGSRFDVAGDGQEYEVRHEPHDIPRSPVLARFLVVFLVESPDQFLEDRAHAVVVQARLPDRAIAVHHRIGAQVDIRRGKFLDQGSESVRLGQPPNLVAELEVVEYVLDVRRVSIKIGLEIGSQLLATGARADRAG